MNDAAGSKTTRIREMLPADAAAVARLHRDRIDIGFISSLGLTFLTVLYRGIVASGFASCVVAEDHGEVVGFVVVARDVSGLYRAVLKSNRWRLIVALLPSLVSLRVWRRCWETLRYPSRGEHADLPPAELLSIAVSQTCAGGGIGKQLVQRALDEVWRQGVGDVRVAVGASLPANRFYQATGWVPAGTMDNHGRLLNIYVRRRPADRGYVPK